MAHVSQELKKQLAPEIMAICKEYGIKATLSVRHHSTLQLNIKSGPLDFMGQYNERGRADWEKKEYGEWAEATYCCPYAGDKWAMGRDWKDAKTREFLAKIDAAMNVGNHDNSDAMTDYFDVGWYTGINVGDYKNPYVHHAEGTEPPRKAPRPKWPILTVKTTRSGERYCTLTNDTEGKDEAWPVDYSVKKHGHRCVEKLQALGYQAHYNGFARVIVTASPWPMANEAKSAAAPTVAGNATVGQEVTEPAEPARIADVAKAPEVVEPLKPTVKESLSVEIQESTEPSEPFLSIVPTKTKPARQRIQVADLPENDEQFYPTPDGLAWELVRKIKGQPGVILDPQAGKGDLLEKAAQRFLARQKPEIYAIEIDNNLRSILQGKGIPVIDSDFLAWSGPDKFDCIIMNPPFATGDRHLLKAIDVMYSGQVVCLLNAETLRNPCTNTRKELAAKLAELGAEIEHKGKRFLGAERRTAVEVAIVSIDIVRTVEEDLFAGTGGTAGPCGEQIADTYEVSTGKQIEEMVADYLRVIGLSTETIVNFYRHHNHVGRYVSLNAEPNSSIWQAKTGQELTRRVQSVVNSTTRKIRVDYWRKTLELPEVKDRLTQKRRKEFEALLRLNESMDFTERNIRQFLLNLIAGYDKTLQDGVEEVFDLLTLRHCYDEKLRTENIHYFNGWKTNSAYRCGQRVIIPIRASYGNPFLGWNGWQLDYQAEYLINDIDLVMSYFNGGRAYQPLSEAIKETFTAGEQSGKSTFFKFKAHKKGTLHLTFLDENILRRFNVAACMGKGWLPGDYGAKPFKDMSPQEQEVAESFEVGGEAQYSANVGQKMFDAILGTIKLLEAA